MITCVWLHGIYSKLFWACFLSNFLITFTLVIPSLTNLWITPECLDSYVLYVASIRLWVWADSIGSVTRTHAFSALLCSWVSLSDQSHLLFLYSAWQLLWQYVLKTIAQYVLCHFSSILRSVMSRQASSSVLAMCVDSCSSARCCTRAPCSHWAYFSEEVSTKVTQLIVPDSGEPPMGQESTGATLNVLLPLKCDGSCVNRIGC